MKLFMGIDPSGDYICNIPTNYQEPEILAEFGAGNYYVVPVNYAGEPVVNGRKLRLRGRADPGNPAAQLTGNKQNDALTIVQMQLSEARQERAREAENRKRAEDLHQALMLRMMEGPKGDSGMSTVLVAMIQSQGQTTAAMMTALSGNKGLSPEMQMAMQKNDTMMNTLLASVLNPNHQPTAADRLMETLAGKAITGADSFDTQFSNYQKFASLAGDGGVKTIAALTGVAKELGIKDAIAGFAARPRVVGNGNGAKTTTVTVETPNGNGHANGTQTPAARALQAVSNPTEGTVSQDQAVAELDALLRDETKSPEDVAACFIRHVNETKAIPGFILGPLISAKDDDAQLTAWWTRLGVPHWATAQILPKIKAALGCINLS